jgi:hypothetical protein
MPLDRDIQVRYVVQDKVHKLFIAFFADEFDERLRVEWLA